MELFKAKKCHFHPQRLPQLRYLDLLQPWCSGSLPGRPPSGGTTGLRAKLSSLLCGPGADLSLFGILLLCAQTTGQAEWGPRAQLTPLQGRCCAALEAPRPQRDQPPSRTGLGPPVHILVCSVAAGRLSSLCPPWPISPPELGNLPLLALLLGGHGRSEKGSLLKLQEEKHRRNQGITCSSPFPLVKVIQERFLRSGGQKTGGSRLKCQWAPDCVAELLALRAWEPRLPLLPGTHGRTSSHPVCSDLRHLLWLMFPQLRGGEGRSSLENVPSQVCPAGGSMPSDGWACS